MVNRAEEAAITLEEVCGALPGGGEHRPGQEATARRVAESGALTQVTRFLGSGYIRGAGSGTQ